MKLTIVGVPAPWRGRSSGGDVLNAPPIEANKMLQVGGLPVTKTMRTLVALRPDCSTAYCCQFEWQPPRWRLYTPRMQGAKKLVMAPHSPPNPSTEAGLGLRKEPRTKANRGVGSPRNRARSYKVASCAMNLTTPQARRR
jgi:hypothetical protein